LFELKIFKLYYTKTIFSEVFSAGNVVRFLIVRTIFFYNGRKKRARGVLPGDCKKKFRKNFNDLITCYTGIRSYDWTLVTRLHNHDRLFPNYYLIDKKLPLIIIDKPAFPPSHQIRLSPTRRVCQGNFPGLKSSHFLQKTPKIQDHKKSDL